MYQYFCFCTFFNFIIFNFSTGNLWTCWKIACIGLHKAFLTYIITSISQRNGSYKELKLQVLVLYNSQFVIQNSKFKIRHSKFIKMNTNEQLITQFYTAFKEKDFKTMQECYADHAVFNDEAFVNLNASQVRAMWQMLITRGKDLVLTFDNVKADDTKGSVEWMATYTFSATKRRVVNHIKAQFTFENGKIVNHTDSFDFYRWASQALGMTGILLGWTSFMKKKVQKTAREGLENFMKKMAIGS